MTWHIEEMSRRPLTVSDVVATLWRVQMLEFISSEIGGKRRLKRLIRQAEAAIPRYLEGLDDLSETDRAVMQTAIEEFREQISEAKRLKA